MSALRQWLARMKRARERRAKVELIGREGGTFREAGRCMLLETYLVSERDAQVELHLSSIDHWEPPYDQEIIPPTEKERIVREIVVELAESNLKVRLVGHFRERDATNQSEAPAP